MLAEIQPEDLKLIGGLITVILAALTSFMWAVFRIVRSALRPNVGKHDSKSLHDKISALQKAVDDRFGKHDRELADHDCRITWLEDQGRKAS